MRTRARGIADFRNDTGQPASAFGGVVGLRIEDRVAAGPSRLRPARAVCTNKPNFRQSNRKGKCCVGKELWLSGPAKSTGKTKPIARSGAPRRCLDCGFPERHRATGVRLRRSCRIADCGLGTNRPPRACAGRLYKQTQFPPERQEGQVLCGKGVMAERTC